jgi:hypothetical protein
MLPQNYWWQKLPLFWEAFVLIPVLCPLGQIGYRQLKEWRTIQGFAV